MCAFRYPSSRNTLAHRTSSSPLGRTALRYTNGTAARLTVLLEAIPPAPEARTRSVDRNRPGVIGHNFCEVLRMNWSEQVILVTGGTGSFGKKFVEIMLREYGPKKVVIFSRDELKQHDMRTSGLDHSSLRYFIGDVRDPGRLERALHGVTVVVHAAALKQV